MKKSFILFFSLLAILFYYAPGHLTACTSVLVSRGASADGSVITSWTYDVAGYAAPFHFYSGGTYPDGDSLRLYCFRENTYIGSILQLAQTYRVVGNMNENQVSIGETTFTGREELHGGNGFIDYGNLIFITLQRASTARDAIRIMDELVQKYGYNDTGEIFSIADKNEAWILEFIGKSEHGRGAVWVAARVPEGYMAAHANQARIRKINWNDTVNWMWAPDVVDFAREMGWFTGSDNDFSFTDVYAPVTPRSLLLCESRVWSIYNRAAPSAGFTSDFWRGVVGAEPYPLFIKPDKKITIQDVMTFHRDHFHNTPYYTGKGIAASPYGNPYRWRPVVFQLEGDTISQYAWKRPVSQPQTAFSYISQARNWLPNPIGGVVWYAVDDTYSTVWMPFYMATNQIPPSLKVANPIEFSWESAFWVFSLLNNFSYDIFNVVIDDIKEVQQELENRTLAIIPAIDKAAANLYKANPQLIEDYLTNFAVNNAENVTQRWRELASYIFVKYNDRYIRKEMRIDSWPTGIGYPDDFNRRAVEERPGFFDMRWRTPEEATPIN